MKKQLIIFLLFLCFASVYAEEVPSINTISGGASAILMPVFLGVPVMPGLTIEYERVLNDNFALAVDFGIDGFILPYIDLCARWYPWAGMFYANLGLGVWRQGFNTWILMPVISPGIGWKFDIGKPNGWNLITGLTGRIFLFEDTETDDTSVNKNSTVEITAKAFFKVGYSF